MHRLSILRGAAAGIVAAGVWAAQQPLDKRVFGSRFDDVELLGRAVVPDGPFYAPGLSLHLINGAIFGAGYGAVAERLPLPGLVAGPLLAVAENTLLWPLVHLVDRFHPARERLPRLAEDDRVFLQATWRHLLFGVVLGGLEQLRRPSPPPPPEPVVETVFSSNGHGNIANASVPITQIDPEEPPH